MKILRWGSRTTALFAATMASFLTAFTGSSVNIALPAIGLDFSMDAILLSWVPTSFLLAAAMFLVPIGRLADIHGRERSLPSAYLSSPLHPGWLAWRPLLPFSLPPGRCKGSAVP